MQFGLTSEIVHELKSLATGYPRFVYTGSVSNEPFHVPVFVYHTIDPDGFEKDLHFLKQNGYQTIGVAELADHLEKRIQPLERAVVLTFDDARSSAWRYAFPLLKKFDMRGVVFVIPGFTPFDETTRPNLSAVWEGRVSLDVIIDTDSDDSTLCSWKELKTMYDSGRVEIESHSLFHQEVFIDDEIRGFLTPHSNFTPFETAATAYLSPKDADTRFEKERFYGLPLFETAPLHAAQPAWRATEALFSTAASIWKSVSDTNDADELTRALWNRWSTVDQSQLFERQTGGDVEQLITKDIAISRQLIKENVGPGAGDHFCLPYTVGSETSVRIMKRQQLRSCHWGVRGDRKYNRPGDSKMRIVRVKSDFLRRLPGEGQASLINVLGTKVSRRWRGERVY